MMILLLLLYFTSTLSVISCTTIPSSVTSMVDLTSLEQMGLAGWYGGISLVTDTQQLTQIQLNTGSALLYKNNTLFQLLASTSISGSIYTSCQQGNDLYIGGYFSTLNQQNVSNIAKLSYNKDGTGQITPLVKGLDGPVYSLYCDTDRIYVGGDFLAPFTSSPQYGDSLAYYGGSMAVWMIKNGTWSSLPWKGVNGPIYSIEKFKGSIYFAGQFDSTTDGQSNHAPASQPINLQKPATVTAEGSDPNYSDASVVICSALDDHPWLLQDNTPGHWEVSFVYAVSPSLFRLGNTFYEGRGTNQFGILATTQNHYLNLSYVDPSTGQRRFCTNNCSLSNDPTVQFQDFLVINPNMTTGVRIDISSWYGLGGGLSSVEIYQSEIFVHAGNVGGFPDCSASEKQQLPVATATTKGKWTNAQTGYTQYLTSTFPAQQLKTNTNSVTFTPNLPEQTGNYSISIYTPGCNNKCQQRTKVDLQIYVNSTSPITVTIDQNTSGDRVDKIYTGPISPTTANFKPRVVLSVSKSATTPTKGNVILVADKVQWIKEASIPGLSSVLVYNPSVQSTTNNTLLPWSTLPQTNNLPWKSQVNTMDIVNGDLYIGGNFSDTNAGNMSYHNIVKLNGQTNQLVPLSGTGGLNGIVSSLTHIGSDLYVGGAFDGFPAQATVATTSPPSKNVIKYNTQQQSWVNLDGGVNGPVSTVALTGNNQTHVLVSGSYTGLYDATGTIIANTTSGNAWWYSATSRWAPSIDQPYLSGIVYTTEMAAPSATDQQRQQLYLGNIKSAQRYAAHGFVYMNNQTIPLAPLPFQPNASMQTDVITAGAFWNDPQHGNASTIILGGSFTLSSPSNSTATIRNVAMYQNGQWQGIGADAWQGSIHTMMVVGNRLFIGGQFSTSTPSGANSFAIYDLVNQTFVHVPDLHTSDGSPTLVNVIKYNDADSVVIVGGNFSTGGSLSCYGVCALDMNEYQWNNLGDGVLGNVTDFVLIDNKLMVAGNLTLANGKAVPVAAYDYGGNYWDTISSDTTENGLPGPCHTVSYDNNTRTTFFAGQTNTSTAYIRMWNGQQFSSPNEELGPGSTIEQLSVLPTVTNTTSNLAGNSKAVLLATGFLNLGQGNVSAALYNGTNWIPYLAASAVDGTSGLFSRVFFKSYSMSVHNTRHLPTPLVILISVASALGVVFVLILSSLMVMFVKRRQEAKVDCAQPWNYYGKPPQTPEALLEMLASGNAVTGLYSLTDSSNNEKGIIGQKAEFGTVVSAATLGATTLGAASMTSNGTTNEKDISPPPAAYLANPTGAFDGPREMQSTTTTREMVTPTTQRSSYNPFRASATLGMAVSEPGVISSQQTSNNNNNNNQAGPIETYYNKRNNDDTVINNKNIVQGDVRWTTANGATDAISTAHIQSELQKQSTLPSSGGMPAVMTMMTMPSMSLAQVERLATDSVHWTTSPAPAVTSMDAVNNDRTVLDTQQGEVMWTHTLPDRGAATLTTNVASADLTATTAGIGAAGMIGTAMMMSNNNETNRQHAVTNSNNNNNNNRTMPSRADTSSPFATYTSSLDHKALDEPAIITTTNNNNINSNNIDSYSNYNNYNIGNDDNSNNNIGNNVGNKSNNIDNYNSNNSRSMGVNSNKQDQVPAQQQGQQQSFVDKERTENTVRWTHFNSDNAQDTLQVKPVTQSTYSEYSLGDYTSSIHDVSTMPISKGLLSEGFSSDPDIARWTTITPDIEKSTMATVAPVLPSSSNISMVSMHDDIKENDKIVPSTSFNSSNSSGKRSAERNTYQSSLRFSSVILPQDIEPPVLKSSSVSPASSRRSSVSSLASYHDTTYGGDDEQPQQESPSTTEKFDPSTSAFRWSAIVAEDTSFADTPTAPTDTSSQSDPHAFLTKPFDLSSSSSSQQQKSSSPSSQQQQSSLPSSQQQPQQQQKQKQSLSSQQQQQSSSSSSQQQGHPALDGRAASKKMIQDYFSSRGELPSGTTTKEESKPYKDDFKRAMQAALENNQANKDQANCSADHPYLYVAKFDFSAREHGELGFEKGDPIIVIDAEDDIWWMGYKDGEKPQQGVFPSNYVERATSLPY